MQCGRPLLLRQPFPPDAFDQVILGCVNVIADEMNPARVAALRLGMGEAMTAFTVQINCGSGMQSIDTAYQYIREGHLRSDPGGRRRGAEPRAAGVPPERGRMVRARCFGARVSGRGSGVRWSGRSFFKPVIGLERGLTDPVVDLNMGQTAEILAHLFHISRRDADAVRGRKPAAAGARAEGKILRGRTGAGLRARRQASMTTTTAYGRTATVEKLAKLRPAFERPWGKVTAGNSSQITDGASWVILASEDAVKKHGLKPRAVHRRQRNGRRSIPRSWGWGRCCARRRS